MPVQNTLPTSYISVADNSRGSVARITTMPNPDHFPIFYGFAERGRTNPQPCLGNQTRLFGDSTFNLRSKFATHATPFFNKALQNGNATYYKRLTPADAAPPATLALFVEVTQAPVPIPQFSRDSSGKYILDVNGNPTPLLNASNAQVTIQGHYFKWSIGKCPQLNAEGQIITPAMIAAHATDNTVDITAVANAIGSASVVSSRITTPTGQADSYKYPFLELEADSFGAWGNNAGIRIFPALSTSSTPVNADVVTAINSMLHRLQIVERPSTSGSPSVINTINDSPYIEFSFEPNAVDTNNNDLYFNYVFADAYSDPDSVIDPYWGEFGRFHVYQNYITTLQQLVATTEATVPASSFAGYDSVSNNMGWMVELLTGSYLNGAPYYTYQNSPLDPGIYFSEVTTLYASGGSDGTITSAIYDSLVAAEMTNFATGQYPLYDIDAYLFNTIYDTGFSVATKQLLLRPLSVRPDLIVHLSTQDANQPQNSTVQEEAIGSLLTAAISQYPESVVNGVPAARASVFKQSGYMVDGSWRGLVPTTFELLDQLSQYLGNGSGQWIAEKAPDLVAPDVKNTVFVNLKRVNDVSLPDSVRAIDYKNGINYAQKFTVEQNFFPELSTVYPDKTSVLNSIITVYGVAALKRVARSVWKQLTGNSGLDDGQLIKASNDRINAGVLNRFNGRFVITPQTYLSVDDARQAFSWSAKIGFAANNMRTVNNVIIDVVRMSSLATA